MATFNSHEFIYVDPEYKGKYSDFTDDSVFSKAERKDFLRKYDEFLKKNYGLGENSEYAVDIADSKRFVERVTASVENMRINGDLAFDKMQAFLEPADQSFKNLYLYTGRAVVEDNCIVLKNSNTAPNPSAMYFLEKDEHFQSLTLDFKIDGEFRGDIRGGILATTHGKTIELRSGIEEVIKFQFYSNGELLARVIRYDKYHPSNIKIGSFRFDEWQRLEISLSSKSFSVRLGDADAVSFDINNELLPDSVFMSSGMFGVGDWFIRPLKLITDSGERENFFEPFLKGDSVSEPLGEVSLPFAVGGEKNKDKKLVLIKEFEIEDVCDRTLEISALDPNGCVYLDGELIAQTDGFDSFSAELGGRLGIGKHELRIEVSPRAPEVLAPWHRHRDPYTGWFCEKVSIKAHGKVRLSRLGVFTRGVKKQITADICGDVSDACTIVCSATKIWPENGEEYEICRFEANGAFSHRAVFDAESWSTETPNLYAIRFYALDKRGVVLSEEMIETGFRTIEQKNGDILLNGEKITLKGALAMQYLPPYEMTPTTHICAPSEQIAWQEMMVKAMGGNTMRMHILGYGSNDARYAAFADRLGILLIWITRYIDSVEQLQWQDRWLARDGYISQLKQRINHPSIIMWEGSNEYHPSLKEIDKIYSEFVSAVKSADNTRLICPVSHLYYAADSYALKGCEYYNNDGKRDHDGNETSACEEWTDELVVRSAHTYILLLGYGTDWRALRTQNWSGQPELLKSTERAYMVSEFAVIGRQDPTTKEAREEYFNSFSYEFGDELSLGFNFTEDEWRLSQAYQALAAHHCIKQLRLNGADGMLWCSLMGGANDGGYLKPPIDNYGYAKLAFYTIREGFGEVYAALRDVDTKKGSSNVMTPVIYGKQGHKYSLTMRIEGEGGNTVAQKLYDDIVLSGDMAILPEWSVEGLERGYYSVKLSIDEIL